MSDLENKIEEVIEMLQKAIKEQPKGKKQAKRRFQDNTRITSSESLHKFEDYEKSEKISLSKSGQWSLDTSPLLEKNSKVVYSVRHMKTHPPGREDDGHSIGGATFHVHRLTAESPKVDHSNHVGTVETDSIGHVNDSDFHHSVPSNTIDSVHDHIQSNHNTLIRGLGTQRKKV